MQHLPSLNLSPREHLDWIRRMDPEHRWDSLSDERYCNKCLEVFSAGDVEIVGGTRAFGPLRLQCPTIGCNAAPGSWLPVANRRRTRSVAAGRQAVRVRTGLRRNRPSAVAPNDEARVSMGQRWACAFRRLAAKLKMLPVPLQCGGILTERNS